MKKQSFFYFHFCRRHINQFLSEYLDFLVPNPEKFYVFVAEHHPLLAHYVTDTAL